MSNAHYRAKAWRAILCILAAFWIIVGAIVAEVMDFSIWEMFA